MVSKTTVRAIRSEYRKYLLNKHPDWTDSTLKTYVSDAFYVLNNDIINSFWNCFLSEENMLAAKKEILEYMKMEIKSDKAVERTAAYYNDLCMLKEFFDEVYGGIEKKIGAEMNAEMEIYDVCKLVYEQKITINEGLTALNQKIFRFSEATYRMLFTIFSCMVEGKVYKRKANTEVTTYFVRHIGEDYGRQGLINALKATYENILYYYKQTGNKSFSVWKQCAKIAQEHNVTEIKFDDSIFAKVITHGITDTTLADKDIESVHYWIYSPGEGSSKWDEFYQNGIMGIGWDDIGNLKNFSTKDDIKVKMKACYGQEYSYKNAAHATWQFANEMNMGDIVFVKKGMHVVIGRGIVESDYIFDNSRQEYKNIRKVRWTNYGLWQHPGQAVMKTLTDITPYTEYTNKLKALFEESFPEDTEEKEIEYPAYSVQDFLDEVYIDEEKYHTLVALLQNKKNIILQGAPGVGKTYAAKRLAYSMIGFKDKERVMMIQFHQSYSYEDFIMGFRPSANGFELKKGPFYEFCKKAEADNENDYFFIIDEINRGNISKIFGELFMLIENDKRGVELQLLYSDEKFSIPENIYMIGMMNTADRSLAMLDYALRRRFAFFEFTPAFDSIGFQKYRKNVDNKKFDKLIAVVEQLNKAIEKDEALGKGFRIGHSYFCTNKEINDDWLKAVVDFEIIPLLEEYWFDEASRVRDWTLSLRGAVQ